MLVCRSDEDDASGGKYTRMEEDNIQDKERFARLVFFCYLLCYFYLPALPFLSVKEEDTKYTGFLDFVIVTH